MTELSVNTRARPLVERLIAEAGALQVAVRRDERGTCLVDAGIEARGSIAAGLLIGEICMGGLGQVRLQAGERHGWPTWVEVRSSQPVLACLGSQYAGWSLAATKEETGGKKFFSLGSGPARALAGKEDLFAELGYRDRADCGVLVMEVDRPPPTVIVDKLLHDCALQPAGLTIVLTPTTSLAGTTQIVARVLETALHKAHTLGFALEHVIEGVASAPLPSPTPDGAQAMGRTNDAILYGGQVHLTVRGDDAAARALAEQLPSTRSRDHGRSFADLFKEAGYDFYKIDPGLFAPAEVWISNLDSGSTWHSGSLNMALLRQLWLQVL
ncbi:MULTISPECIES: methenyltetrahydromethanopterin cyclohydrolase [unclassified Rhizobacter]|uniref:methenyltetrahydromethanopterin cyclohydrolase n=1 Tax=unclassified Rhizobacter TaxID=2640088 RepID=UPI0006F51D21|nr:MULTISPECIES: methenyltetrahydromethanopterin cyclohydrolase [unclassified Rhizobacter]KQU77193.1 methenyltetrahydromethanopterin cyclohydrolase [Rhizobacter sp. Root29]KQW12734.1 methenyltetrahydromethanopterin cyclohydrolase [Rhizobacter sp. Root1238]KRB22322.1 methenyltetrahydromethanopterin cyclohydrolase [Rhizobacter sp. Root16D2]